jgi:phycocyanobilin:ferredoxin oxidoreductase
MSEIWDTLIDCQNEIIEIFDSNAEEIFEPGMEQFNKPGWINRVWQSYSVRRAHIDVVDARDTRGLWMMHVCVFPVLSSDAPIYGFDVIAGKNKMTGAFLDFSKTVHHEHDMYLEYQDMVKEFVPTKERNLPEWATNIFSDSMIAAGNVNTTEESNKIVTLALDAMKYYFENIINYVGNADERLVADAQNWYCDNQTQNPHTPRVMKSLGLDEHDVDVFCKKMLFPRIA